jgi:hypothetical protein
MSVLVSNRAHCGSGRSSPEVPAARRQSRALTMAHSVGRSKPEPAYTFLVEAEMVTNLMPHGL